MALWLIRGGSHGEHEQRFLDDSRVWLTWSGLNVDLSKVGDVESLRKLLTTQYPTFGEKKIINHASQIWPFAHEMEPGDWAVVPSKSKAAIHVAEITGGYVANPGGPDPYFHYRSVKWIAKDLPRSLFAQDLLYSLGAFMTICRIQRNDAEARIKAIVAAGYKGGPPPSKPIVAAKTGGSSLDATTASDEDGPADVDLEELASDAIAKLIIAKFKGHGLSRLVDAILRAQGYVTHLSPPGADKGVDILAAPEPLGFGKPRLCVQVKSEQGPIDRPTLDQLIGAMQNFHAEQGLLVAWGGFKQSVLKELPAQFFRVRLWDQPALIAQLIAHYGKLDADVRAELPLKQIWTVATEDTEE